LAFAKEGAQFLKLGQGTAGSCPFQRLARAWQFREIAAEQLADEARGAENDDIKLSFAHGLGTCLRCRRQFAGTRG
jgi:hypothetical protein